MSCSAQPFMLRFDLVWAKMGFVAAAINCKKYSIDLSGHKSSQGKNSTHIIEVSNHFVLKLRHTQEDKTHVCYH